MISENEFLSVYRSTVKPLYAYISCRTRERELTEDTVQEAYTRAITHWRQRGKPRIPLAWLKTVARNILISYYRRIKHKSLEAIACDLEDKSWIPESKDSTALLYLGLAHLKKGQANLLETFYFDGLSIHEIATTLGLSERAVEGRMRRAKLKLKKYLQRRSTDGGQQS